MPPKNILLSLDGGTFALLQNYLQTNQLAPNSGLSYLANKGVFAASTVITPSLTAPSHIAIATGSSAAKNDINSNSFHLVESPFNSNISGFGAPIGGYDALNPDGPRDTDSPTAEPLWIKLREAGKIVVAATFPGADGIDVRLPGVANGPTLQPKNERTVDYTVPFGAFGGLSARGFSLTAANFSLDATQATKGLSNLGLSSFSAVRVASLESIPATGSGSVTGGSSSSYNLQIAAIDTTNDGVVNYDQAIVFDANRGIEKAANLPSTGSAVISITDSLKSFYFEGSNNKVGAAFILTNFASDLSAVRLVRTSSNYIPRPAESPGVIANVDDINRNVGFWQPQPDFRLTQRIGTGFATYPEIELERAYEGLVKSFVKYQTDVVIRSIQQNSGADLVLGYLEQPDGSEHQFLINDPRQATNPSDPNSIGAGQDLAKIQRYESYVRNAYQTVSDAVQRIIDVVGLDTNGLPNSNIIVTSDHGFSSFHTSVNANTILSNAGFDPNKVRAVFSGPAVNIYINLKGHEPNGTVEVSEYKDLQQKVMQTLRNALDTNPNYATGGVTPIFDKVYDRSVSANPSINEIINASSEFIGQDTGDVFALLSVGYNFDGFQTTVRRKGDVSLTGQSSFLSVPTFYGAHGYDPNNFNLQGIFLAAGPDINKTTLPNLQRIKSIDIAPTLLELLKVTPASTIDGQSIFKQSRDDAFLLGDGNNIVYAGEGANWVATGSGNDSIYAGSGKDSITVSNGNNLVYAGEGANWVSAGIGDDTLYGGSGVDSFNAGNGNNTIYAGEGNNVITTGNGIDIIYAGAGNDVIYSGAGNDVIYAGEGNNVINAGTGNNTVYSGNGADRFILNAGAGSVDIIGFGANDAIALGTGLSTKDLKFEIRGLDTLVMQGDDLLAALKWVQLKSVAIV